MVMKYKVIVIRGTKEYNVVNGVDYKFATEVYERYIIRGEKAFVVEDKDYMEYVQA